jgi:hypothetical protein
MFLPDGTADGVRILTKSNWTGSGVVCPRSLLPTAKARDEFGRPGVYVLVGPPAEDGDLPTMYVGQGDPVRPRLESHFREKDFWTWAIFFTASDGSLTTAHVRHLESRLIALATAAKRAVLDNGNAPNPPALSEADRADAEGFLEDLLSVVPLVGLDAFETPGPKPERDGLRLRIEWQGIRAEGEDRAGGFVVFVDSLARVGMVDSVPGHTVENRKDLQAQGVLVSDGGHLRFTQDYTFPSPSSAACVVLGRSANGRTEWKDERGRTLKQIQEAAIPDPAAQTDGS